MRRDDDRRRDADDQARLRLARPVQVRGLAELLAEELGSTVSGLRQLGSDGKITGDVIRSALLGNLTRLREEFETVKYVKPASSRKDSAEVFLVALNKR